MPRPSTGDRSGPRDIAELRALATRQPDLATAAGLHAELVMAIRRVESRISTPSLDVPVELLQTRLTRGVPLASFGEFPVDWADVRLLIRQITDVFRRLDVIDPAAVVRLHGAGRDASLSERARVWYEQPFLPGQEVGEDPDPLWPEILQWALKPFLVRTAEVLTRQVDLEHWRRGHCPVCAAEPEFGALTASGAQVLLCGRCHARWPFDQGCPFCGHHDAADLRTFATADRVYRVTRCSKCDRYLKVLDTQAAGRALLPFYDPVATLPLDAAMMQG
jgi:Protein involved in formate dehydrogenase formation